MIFIYNLYIIFLYKQKQGLGKPYYNFVYIYRGEKEDKLANILYESEFDNHRKRYNDDPEYYGGSKHEYMPY